MILVYAALFTTHTRYLASKLTGRGEKKQGLQQLELAQKNAQKIYQGRSYVGHLVLLFCCFLTISRAAQMTFSLLEFTPRYETLSL